ncbi:unnamed protein product [Protopolystoma xenopodis]|uniref:Uncharacterized protein n=1 Tax=Protopolystoma xenopodis TaxID=117903 RepID=A0A448WIT5_9PLAT|nr:unnamed protein product [Protopolystoma xenopodis]
MPGPGALLIRVPGSCWSHTSTPFSIGSRAKPFLGPSARILLGNIAFFNFSPDSRHCKFLYAQSDSGTADLLACYSAFWFKLASVTWLNLGATVWPSAISVIVFETLQLRVFRTNPAP